MQRKRIHILTLSLLILAIAIAIAGCGKSGVMKANLAPTITITSFEGYDDTTLLSPFENTTFVFMQKIYWHATDPDGVIEGFAYRILDDADNPVATPGNHFIDLNGDITPKNVLDKFGPGWVMHYMPNANQDIPLDDPEARRSIWTSQKYAVINLPAADANGNPLVTLSKFEVIAIDNRGEVTQQAAWRKFKATSARPRCFISTTKGNPGGDEVGSGIRLAFSMKDFDPFVPELPYKYEFKMMKIDKVTGAEIPGHTTDWINTVNPQDPDVAHYLLTRYSNPPLSYDVENGVVNSKTKILGRVYDMSGVVSTVSDSSAITFAVKAGFRPKTIVYPQKAYALGDNHFVDYADDTALEVYPFTIVGGSQRFATPFFLDFDNTHAAINSTNMKVWIRWGWHGEYGQVQSSGPILFTDNPYDKKVDTVLDRTTHLNYFSEITHFDLRFDGEAYEYAPYMNDPSRFVTDSDTGKKWLRVPLYSPLGQTVVLTYPKILDGTHTFEVRCVDLQGEVDPQPATFVFNLSGLTPASQREGVLVIDDDTDNATSSPEAIVNAKYANMLSDYAGEKVFIKRGGGQTYQDYLKRHFSPTELQKYKLVVYHSDNPGESGNLKYENDGFTLYMLKGGNFMVSHTAKLAETLQAFALSYQKTFLRLMGVPYDGEPAKYLSNALQRDVYFQKAVGAYNYPDVRVAYEAPNESFNTLVNRYHGLSTISYFKDNVEALVPGTDIVYSLGCKSVDYEVSPPNQANYDKFNNRPVGVRKTNQQGKSWLFGFPLSYMVEADAKAMMNKVLSEI